MNRDELLQELNHYRFKNINKPKMFSGRVSDSTLDERTYWGVEMLLASQSATAIKTFEYQSYIIKHDINDSDNVDHREEITKRNGVAGLVTKRIADQAFLGGWKFKTRDKQDITEKDYPKSWAMKKILDDLFFMVRRDKIIDIPPQINRERNAHAKAIMLMHFEGDVTKDSETDAISYKNLETPRPDKPPIMLEVFGPRGVTSRATRTEAIQPKNGYYIDVNQYNEVGEVEEVTITIYNTKGGQKQDYKVHWSRVLWYIGDNELQGIWDDLQNLIWNSYAFADFSVNRGAFLILKQLSSNKSDAELLQDLAVVQHMKVRGCAVINADKEVITQPPRSAAVDIGSAIGKNIIGIAGGSGIPESKIVGAQTGQYASSRADMMSYYPKLEKQQLDFEKQIMWPLIGVIDKDFDEDVIIVFDMQFNLSDMEQADLNLKRIDIKQKEFNYYAGYFYDIKQIAEKMGEELPNNTEMQNIVPMTFEKEMAELTTSPIQVIGPKEEFTSEPKLIPENITDQYANQIVDAILSDKENIPVMVQKIFEKSRAAENVSQFQRDTGLHKQTIYKLKNGDSTATDESIEKGLKGVVNFLQKEAANGT